ncbi:MAG: hypothetical protein AAFV26_02815, partial [Pseudomonadota bacterium]
TGRLVAPFDFQVEAGRAFYFACPEGEEERPNVRAFRDWVRDEFKHMEVDCERVAKPGYAPTVGRGAFAAPAKPVKVKRPAKASRKAKAPTD